MSGVPSRALPASIVVRPIAPHEWDLARATFAMMAAVFEEPQHPLDDAYLGRLLSREDFRALVALDDGVPVGGITGHLLPLTRVPARELFIYDLAVHEDWQRRGIGRALVEALQAQAAAEGVTISWVPADNDDTHALDFYRAVGGAPAAVTIFSFDVDGANSATA